MSPGAPGIHPPRPSPGHRHPPARDAGSRITRFLITSKGQLVVGQYGAIALWNPEDPEPLRRHTRPRGYNLGEKREVANHVTGLCETADGNLLVSDITAVWRWNLADDSFTPISAYLLYMEKSLANDRYYTGYHNHQPWFRDADPNGVSFWLSLPAPVHDLAASPDKAHFAVALGGGYGSDVTRWLWAGPTDLWIIPLADIDKAFARERDRKLAGFPARQRADPKARLDYSTLPDAPITPGWN